MRTLITVFLFLFGCSLSWASDGQPVQVFVSIEKQSLKVYKGGEVIAESRVSTGKRGYSTPTGIFSILNKKRRHYSNIYNGAPMPYMQRLTWSGIALHASNSVPSYPASHGCVRLPHRFAKELFSLTESGAHVVIAPGEVAPQPIRHHSLFQPVGAMEVLGDVDRWVRLHVEQTMKEKAREPVQPLRIFVTRRAQRQEIIDAQKILNKLGYQAGPVDGILGRGTRTAIRNFEESLGKKPTGEFDREFLADLYGALGKPLPANGHIYVRRNFRPVYDAPVNIKNADEPLGAHLLTATPLGTDNTQLEWMHVSLPDKPRAIAYVGETPESNSANTDISSVLRRLEIDAETRLAISRMLVPGSSFSISDNGLSHETGAKGTDFIILTKSSGAKSST